MYLLFFDPRMMCYLETCKIQSNFLYLDFDFNLNYEQHLIISSRMLVQLNVKTDQPSLFRPKWPLRSNCPGQKPNASKGHFENKMKKICQLLYSDESCCHTQRAIWGNQFEMRGYFGLDKLIWSDIRYFVYLCTNFLLNS